MKFTRLIGPSLGLAAGLALAACGGGSSSGAPTGNTPSPPAPAPTAVTAIGSITGFGSVYVNGTRYEVEADTIIDIEDEAESMGDDSRLRLGMKVRVEGRDDNGQRSASRIEFDEDLKGPIESITPDAADPAFGMFSLMSQSVTVDARTVFDDDIGNNDANPGIGFRDLQVGMIVEVSGFPTADGILATRVDRELDAIGGNPDVGQPGVDGDELELKGFVDNIASDLASITVSGVVFIVNGVTIFEDGLQLNDDLRGVFVEVKADVAGAEYVAVRVEREDDFGDGNRNGEVEFEGVLQSVDTNATPNTFTIDGITVPVLDASSLAGLVGMRIEIKGSFNTDQVLVLREAEQDVEDDVRTEDLVEIVDINSATPNFTTRLGLVITPTGMSRVRDNAGDNDDDNLTPAQFVNRLQMGDRIEARGFENVDGSVTWTGVERDEQAASTDDFDCELRGPVTSIQGDATSFSFDIQGVTVSTDRVSDNNFEGANDQPIGRAAFFADLREGVVVEATSFDNGASCMTGALDAREIEFEPADGS